MNASDSRPEREIADLARLLPVPTERDLAADRHLLLKEHLMTEVHAAIPGFRVARWPGVGRGALMLAAGLAVLAITVTATALGTLARSGGTSGPVSASGPPPTGSALLHHAAAAAARVHAARPRPKEFAYVAIDVAYGRGRLHEKQIWIPVSNLCDGLTIQENGGVSGSACASGPGGPAVDLGTITSYPTYKLLRSLPTRTIPLLAYIRAHDGKSGSQDLRVMRTIGNILIQSIAPPELNAALYRVAAKIPGLRVVQGITDPRGRPGIGLEFSSGGARIEWVFSPKTFRLLGERITDKDSKQDRQFAILHKAFVKHGG